jgi:hypothetical protein
MCWKAILEALKPRPTVVIQICALTGARAGDYCPEVVRRRFYVDPRPGEPVLPAESCSVHEKPADPPQPPPPPVYPPQADPTEPRTGLDVYQLIVFPLEQIRQYLDDLVRNGGSIQRMFMDFTWPTELETAGWRFSIFKQAGWWTDPEGPFAGQRFPLFTIAESEEYGQPWNEAVLAKWAAVLKMCADRGIQVTLCIFDGCSMKSALDRRHQPLLHNYQHLGAEAGIETYERMDGTIGRGLGIHTGGVYGGFGGDDGSMVSYLPAIGRKVVDLVRASGVDYRIMPGNEMAREREGEETQAHVDGILRDWHDYMIKLLLDAGAPEDRIVVSITGTNTREAVTLPLLAKYPKIVEQVHGPNSPETLARYLDRFQGAEIEGDGFDSNAAGHTNSYGFGMPSIEQARLMREILKVRDIPSYSTFNGYVEEQGWQDIAAAGWEEQRALAGK